MINALQLLPAPPDASLIYVGSYSPIWVVISVLLAILASYAALNASTRIEHLHDTASRLTLTVISVLTLGVGIWAMHFIGMLALRLPCTVYCDPLITLISMIPGVLASGVALGVVWHHGAKRLSLLVSSILFGAGIATMHYTGMAAMRLDGFVRYDPSLFALSIFVAIALSYLALRVKSSVVRLKKRHDVLVAVVMGGAVSGMHYTGMSAAEFVKGDLAALPPSIFTTNTLALIMALSTAFLALATLAVAAISRNREMTSQLRNSEERWKFALEGARDGVWDWNPQTDEALFSKRWKEMVGYAEHEFPDTGTALVEHLHPGDKDRVLSTIQEYFAGNKPLFDIEYRMRCKDGSWKWILTRGKLVSRDANGNPLRMIGTHTDISDRKCAEESLLRSEAKFRTLYDSTSNAVMLLGEHGFFDCNKAALAIFGCATQEEFCSKRPTDLSPPEQPCGTNSMMLASQRIATAIEKGSLRYEWVHKRADTGECFPAEVLLSALKLNGKPALQATVRDITERKQAEKELRISAIAFESQEGMMVTDANNRILRVNRAFTKITGYTAEEVIDKNPRIFHSGRQNADFYAAIWGSIKLTDSWKGEIWNRRKNGEIFPELLTITAVKDKDGVITNYVATFNDITLSKAAADEITNLAFYDPLTKLPNRRLLLDRLHQAVVLSVRTERQGALLFIDLDNFKTINDTQGHAIGDLLLVEAANRLQCCMRAGDTSARLGGDEFVILLENLDTDEQTAAAQTETVGEKILTTIRQPYFINGQELHSTASIGITLFRGQVRTMGEMLKRADVALHQAKADGRNTVRFFDPVMQALVTARVTLETELRRAVSEQVQLLLYYQAQVDSMGRLIGAESLVRWMHPERGIVLPGEFIPLAEESELILSLGRWVLTTACRQLGAWSKQPETAHLTMAVNISARQFRMPDFVEEVLALIEYFHVDPTKLKLEITESMLLEDVDSIIAKMTELKTRGISFSMDDFGTGYSSLQYLKRLPLDHLKIDQSFVCDIAANDSDKAIVRTIIAMAQSLNLTVIAEGVETEEQRQLLLNKGCTSYQGYLFGRPVPIELFESQMRQVCSL